MQSNTKLRKREFFSYDGTVFIGRILVDGKTGDAKAFNAAGRLLGEFADYNAARKAISNAYGDAQARRTATAKTLEHLNRANVEFASGLPTDIGGGWGR